MKSVIRSIKNEIYNYCEGERLVRELTSNEPTPPNPQMLVELLRMLDNRQDRMPVVHMISKRLKDYNNILHVEKALICIEFLIINANIAYVNYFEDEKKKEISNLMRFRYNLKNGKGAIVDYGGNIRKRANCIYVLLNDKNKLHQTRAKARGHKTSKRATVKRASSQSKVAQQRVQNTPEQKTANDDNQQTDFMIDNDFMWADFARIDDEKHNKEQTQQNVFDFKSDEYIDTQQNNEDDETEFIDKVITEQIEIEQDVIKTVLFDDDYKDSKWFMSKDDMKSYHKYFIEADLNKDGVIDGEEANAFFSKSKLNKLLLAKIYFLADQKKEGKLSEPMFCVMYHIVLKLLKSRKAGNELNIANDLPDCLAVDVLDKLGTKIQKTVKEKKLVTQTKKAQNENKGNDVLDLNFNNNNNDWMHSYGDIADTENTKDAFSDLVHDMQGFSFTNNP